MKHVGEVHVTDITENSAKLHWVDPEPQHASIYDITITLAHDHSLVLKLNLTGTERVIGGLGSGQKYHVLVTGYRNAQARSTYTGTFSTSKFVFGAICNHANYMQELIVKASAEMPIQKALAISVSKHGVLTKGLMQPSQFQIY